LRIFLSFFVGFNKDRKKKKEKQRRKNYIKKWELKSKEKKKILFAFSFLSLLCFILDEWNQ